MYAANMQVSTTPAVSAGDPRASSSNSTVNWASVGVAYALSMLTTIAILLIFCAIKYWKLKKRKKSYYKEEPPIYDRQRSHDSHLGSQRSKISTVSESSHQPMLRKEEKTSSSSTGKAYIRVNSDDAQKTTSGNSVPEYRVKRDAVSQWCTKHNLSEHTAHRLRESGFSNEEYLDCLTSAAIPSLKLRTTAEECKLRLVLEDKLAAKQIEQKPRRSSGGSSGAGKRQSPHRPSHPSQSAERQYSSGTNRGSAEVPSVFNSSGSTEFDDVDGGPPQPGGKSSGAVYNRQNSRQENPKGFRGMLSDAGLFEMSEKIGMEWTGLATLLRITHSQQEQVIMNYQGNSRKQIYEILRLWRDRSRGKKEQVKGELHEALQLLGRKDLAETLMRETVEGSNENVRTHSIV